MLSLRRLRFLLLIIVALAALIYLVARPRYVHGLTGTYYGDAEFGLERLSRVEQAVMLSSNDTVGIDLKQPFSARWEGYLWIAQDGEYSFGMPRALSARLLLDNVTVFNSISSASPDDSTVALDRGLHPIVFELIQPAPNEAFFLEALTWGAESDNLIDAALLYPSLTDETIAASEARRLTFRNVALWVVVAALLALLATFVPKPSRWLRSREFWLVFALVGLAFALRLIYLNDLVTQIPDFDALPDGSDHRVYESDARDLVRGVWPQPVAFRVQPGFSWLLGNVHALLSPDIRTFQLLQIIGGSLATIACYLAGKRIFGVAAGALAAFLWAIFPQAIFYDAQLVTHGLEAQLVLWIILFWVVSIDNVRETEGNWSAWVSSALLGLLVGIASIIRPALLALLPLAALSLLWFSRSNLRVGLGQFALFLVLAIAPILPVTVHNTRHADQFILISNNAPITLYLGNNRDAAGIGEYSPAFLATHERVNRGETDYIGQTLADVRARPVRWLGLMVRKAALYFANVDIPNNVDFYTEGVAVSPLLRWLSVSFGVLAVLGLSGLILGLASGRRYAPGAWLVASVVLVLFAATIAFHVVSRFRVPVYGPLAIFGGFTLALLGRYLLDRDMRGALRVLGVLALVGLGIAALPWVAENSLPRPTVSSLPTNALRVDAPIGETLELVGYDPLPAVEPGEPVFVTLYWRPKAPLPEDYFGTLQAFNTQGTKLVQVDQKLGTGSFPQLLASEWQPGQIIRDQYLLFMPRDAATPVALDLLAAVYQRETNERLGEVRFGPLPLTAVEPLVLPDEAVAVNAMVGLNRLAGYVTQVEGEELHLTLYWEALAQMPVNGVVFVHLLDASGNFIAGQDQPPLSGNYPFNAWQVGEGVVDTYSLPINALAAGEYTLSVGVYDPDSLERFEIWDVTGDPVADRSLELGQVTLP